MTTPFERMIAVRNDLSDGYVVVGEFDGATSIRLAELGGGQTMYLGGRRAGGSVNMTQTATRNAHVAVKLAADEQASQQQQRAQSFMPPLQAVLIKPNFKFFRRLAGLRGSDLDRKQDERYDANGERVRK
jgi:hypothetical protein